MQRWYQLLTDGSCWGRTLVRSKLTLSLIQTAEQMFVESNILLILQWVGTVAIRGCSWIICNSTYRENVRYCIGSIYSNRFHHSLSSKTEDVEFVAWGDGECSFNSLEIFTMFLGLAISFLGDNFGVVFGDLLEGEGVVLFCCKGDIKGINRFFIWGLHGFILVGWSNSLFWAPTDLKISSTVSPASFRASAFFRIAQAISLAFFFSRVFLTWADFKPAFKITLFVGFSSVLGDDLCGLAATFDFENDFLGEDVLWESFFFLLNLGDLRFGGVHATEDRESVDRKLILLDEDMGEEETDLGVI